VPPRRCANPTTIPASPERRLEAKHASIVEVNATSPVEEPDDEMPEPV
jgi:hypothetical protein